VIVAHRRDLREGEEGAQVVIEELARVAGVVSELLLEGGQAPPDEPLQHFVPPAHETT
jgi:hypothetical protein